MATDSSIEFPTVSLEQLLEREKARRKVARANRRAEGGKPARPKSRPARWAEAASAAVAALETLSEIQAEYQEWRDNLPENLQDSALGEKLQAVCDLDLDSALDAANEADGADLPLGFGRD